MKPDWLDAAGRWVPKLRAVLLNDWRVPLAVVSTMASLALFSSVYFYVKIQNESQERRHQICLRDEREHLKDVHRLQETYRFLVDPPAALWDLRTVVRAQLSRTESDARDRAPQFCDDPEVGLPEPDPVIPSRPKSLR